MVCTLRTWRKQLLRIAWWQGDRFLCFSSRKFCREVSAGIGSFLVRMSLKEIHSEGPPVNGQTAFPHYTEYVPFTHTIKVIQQLCAYKSEIWIYWVQAKRKKQPLTKDTVWHRGNKNNCWRVLKGFNTLKPNNIALLVLSCFLFPTSFAFLHLQPFPSHPSLLLSPPAHTGTLSLTNLDLLPFAVFSVPFLSQQCSALPSAHFCQLEVLKHTLPAFAPHLHRACRSRLRSAAECVQSSAEEPTALKVLTFWRMKGAWNLQSSSLISTKIIPWNRKEEEGEKKCMSLFRSSYI